MAAAGQEPLIPAQPQAQPEPGWQRAQEWLGPWWVERFLEPEAVAIAMGLPDPITSFHCSGPALMCIRHATFVLWPFALFYPLVVLICLTDCPTDGQPIADYLKVAYLLALPVVGWALYYEVKALRWTLATYASYCAPFKITFIGDVSMSSWAVFIAAMSLTTHADMVTNGLFLAQIRRTATCPVWDDIENVWRKAIEEAILLNHVPWLYDLSGVALCLWLLMFLQPVMAFVVAWPWPPSRAAAINYEAATDAHTNRGEPGGYRTLWANVPIIGELLTWHSDAVQWFATVNRMVSLTEKNFVWTLERAQHFYRDGRYDRTYKTIKAEFQRVVLRLLLVNLVEKAFMLEMQVTAYAISRHFDKASSRFLRGSYFTLVSLVLTFATFLKVLYDAVWQIREIRLKIDPLDVAAFAPLVDGVEGRRQALELAQSQLFWWRTIFLVVVIFLVAVIAHSFAKFVMAFACKDAIWNIPDPFVSSPLIDSWGCVKFD